MHSSDSPVHHLLRFLPALPEFAEVREALLASSSPDPSRVWERTSAYATFDKRVIDARRLEEVMREAADAARRRVDEIYTVLTGVLTAAAAGDEAGAIARLIDAGEAAEAEGSGTAAVAFYDLASRLSEPLLDRRPLVLGLRRAARARASLGELEEAYALYRRSREQAIAVGDREGRIVAATGLGNMRNLQGRWAEAQAHYGEALDLCESEDLRLRGQLCINLSMSAREQRLLDEAAEWLQRAEPLWETLSRPDRCGWLNNQGLLLIDRGETEKAEAALRQALEHAESSYDRAMTLDNLADLEASAGRSGEAEALARQAEEEALAAGSPYALAEVYTCLGRICRLADRPDGVTFFEKALELCREHRYPLLEARASLEYGLFRQGLGGAEEARAYFDRARDLFAEVGAAAEQESSARASAPPPA